MIALGVTIAAPALPSPAHAADLALTGARLIVSPDRAPIEDGVIVVRDGRIAAAGRRGRVAIPRGAVTVDARGTTATAGFWNSHVHLITPETLRSRTATDAAMSDAMRAMFLRWGFTTVYDIASSLENTVSLRARIAAGKVAGPDILTVGDPFYPLNGTPNYVRELYRAFDLPLAEVATAEQAIARVRAQGGAGAQGVKIFTGAIVGGEVGVLPMDLSLARAIVAAADARGMPVFAHPTNDAGLAVAIDSGADILAHVTPETGPWSAARVRTLVSRRMAVTPTLALFRVEGRRAGNSDAAIEGTLRVAQQQVGAFARAGGQILFGTDIGYTPEYDTREELRLLHGAGLDWRAILTSLTTAPASRFGRADRGRLAAGMAADIVLLDGDPTRDVAALSRVRCTFRAGVVVYEGAAEACGSGVHGASSRAAPDDTPAIAEKDGND